MAFRVEISPQAFEDLDIISAYIRQRGSFESAERWFNGVIAKVRKGGTSEFFRESLFDVLVAGQNVGHQFGMPVLANRLASV